MKKRTQRNLFTFLEEREGFETLEYIAQVVIIKKLSYFLVLLRDDFLRIREDD